MPTIRELKEQRAQVIVQARNLYDAAKKDNRDVLNDTERAEFDKRMAAVDEIDAQIRSLEQHEADGHRLRALEESLSRADNRRTHPPDPQNRNARNGRNAGADRGSEEYRSTFSGYIRGELPIHEVERRGMLLGTNSAGGYMSLPTDLADELLETIDDMCDLYSMCTKLVVDGATSVGIPKISARGDDADWTTEIQSVTADTGLTFARGDLTPIMLTKLIKAARVFLNRVRNSESVLFKQLGRLFGVTWEKALLTGSGSGQPRGIFTASASGIPTSRDVSTGNTITEISYDGLINAKYTLKQAYLRRPTTVWIANPAFMANVLKLRDGQDRPLFCPGDQQGRDDMLLGIPVRFSEFAPNTWTTGQYVAALGDMSQMYIAEAVGGYSVQVVDQTYAATNEIGIFGRLEADANAQQAEAFVRVTLA